MHNVSRTVRNTKINMCANNLQFLKDKFPCQCASLAPWPEILCLTQRYWVVGCSYTLQLSKLKKLYSEVEKTGSIFCSFTQPCPTLCSPMDCNMLFLCPSIFQEFAYTHVYWFNDGIQPSYPLLPASPALSLSQHQGLFWWASSLYHVAKVSELQL